ncbi:MAG: elongation factor G [Candidatus Sumerlaeia bacterium]|nr:elongation factor G [Candidatus Sumerlaeia bacterium]
MKVYRTEQIRNVALTGHSGSGKTTLAEALLFRNGSIPKMGRTETKNTQSDYDPVEQERQISVNVSLLPVDTESHKFNIIDCPGSRDFVGDMKNGIRVAEMSLLVLDAVGAVEVGTEFAWDYSLEYQVPRAVFVNKMDKDRANFRRCLDSVAAAFETQVVALTLPIGEGTEFKGVIDLLRMKAVYEDERGVERLEEIPAAMRAEADAARKAMIEAAAEGDDELTEKFLMEEELSLEEVMRGLREDLVDGRWVPALCGSATSLKGLSILQQFLINECPSPDQRRGFHVLTDDHSAELVPFSSAGPFSAYVFKTVNDDYAGRLSLFKVVTGEVAGDGILANLNHHQQERVGHVFDVRGKAQLPVEKICTGDIGAFAKLTYTHTGDTIADPKYTGRVYEITRLPKPSAHMALHVKNRTDEDKISLTLHRILEADPTLHLERDSANAQTILHGMGDTHLEVALLRIKAAAKVEVELVPPRIAYRETITRKAEGQGKYKKQSGGRGQYGDCHIRFEPLERGGGFQFEWEIVGGVIPTNFKGSVEKGLLESIHHGTLAGFPVVDLKAACYYGSYHAVDSSDMAFQVAASLAFKEVIPKCAPVILEPFHTVTVFVPDQYMGDVMGYISQHRGRISGNESESHKVTIIAEMPQGEMLTFSRDLRSMTQGRGVYESEFSHYEAAPPPVQEKVIADAKEFAAQQAG